MPFTLHDNLFKKCLPAISTNIQECGTVTLCDAKPVTEDELSSVYMKSSEFRVMEALLFHDMEIKMCETVQNGLYEFLMANRVNLSKRINTRRANSGLLEVAPFILARQYSPINNDYWAADQGAAAEPEGWPAGVKTALDGGLSPDWHLRIKSTTNIPASETAFPPGLRIFVDGVTAGGVASKTAWEVLDSTTGTMSDVTYVFVSLKSQNENSNLDADKTVEPVSGLVRRGTPNKHSVEKWCNEAPSYLNWKNVPFWGEYTRTTMCNSSLYSKWKKLVTEGNALYREFFDLDEIAKNRQLATDWMKRWVNAVFWNKALPNQDMNNYDNLDDIDTYDITTVEWAGARLGVDGGRCVGKRANAVGVYEQLAECGRVFDALGEDLNLGALFRELYNIMRVREANGRPNTSIDIFTDTVTANKFNRAMIEYYDAQAGGRITMNLNIDSPVKKANFGFNYRSYVLFWPNVTINIITHFFFDDWLAAAKTISANQERAARVLWVLDFAGIYPGILSSKRAVHKTGDLKTLASVNPDFACVLDVPSQEQTLTELQYTVIVECPASNLIIENFSSNVPAHADDESIDYAEGASFTTTTAA